MKKLCVNAIIKTHVKINHSTSTENSLIKLIKHSLPLHCYFKIEHALTYPYRVSKNQGQYRVSQKNSGFFFYRVSPKSSSTAPNEMFCVWTACPKKILTLRRYISTLHMSSLAVITRKTYTRFSRRLSSSNQGFKIRYSIYF